jgi:CPA1 family monovalent cation:H+ antiporter
VLLILFNGLVFILIGLQLAAIREIAIGISWGSLIGYAAAISAVVIGVRLVYVPIGIYVPRLLSRRLRQRDPYPPWQAVAIIAWTGIRGMVSLALALALPLTLPSGDPFPQRAVVIVISFAVILVTLVVQAPTLPWLLRLFRLGGEDLDLREEREALLHASQAALDKLAEIDDTTVINPLLLERARAPYQERLTRLTTLAREDPECRLTEGEAAAYRRLRDQALAAERKAVVALRNQGKISEEVLHRVQEALDLEALQPDR